MSDAPTRPNREPKRGFWTRRAASLIPFLVTVISFVGASFYWSIQDNLYHATSLEYLTVGLPIALTLTGLTILGVLMGVSMFFRFSKRVGLGILTGVAVGLIIGGPSCFAIVECLEYYPIAGYEYPPLPSYCSSLPR
jgi:uncharacterized BrkB/YihY/UPF0761 family membrane protein